MKFDFSSPLNMTRVSSKYIKIEYLFYIFFFKKEEQQSAATSKYIQKKERYTKNQTS